MPSDVPVVLVGKRLLAIEDVLALARGKARPALDPDPEVHRRLRATVEAVDRRLARGDLHVGADR